MKKHLNALFILFAAAIALFAGCSVIMDNPKSETSGGYASVNFAMAGQDRAAGTYTLANVRNIKISALKEDAAYPEVYRVQYNSSSKTFLSRPISFAPGLWHFTVQALNSSGLELYSGKQDVTLAADTSTTVTFTLLQSDYDASSAEDYVLDMTFGRNPRPGEFNTLNGVCFGSDDAVYASDADNHWIQIFDSKTGEFREGVGGSNAWMLNTSFQIAYSSDGSLWVADSPSGCVKHMVRDANGQWSYSTLSSAGPGDYLSMPEGVAIAPDGSVFVASTGNGTIQKYGSDSVWKSSWSIRRDGDSMTSSPSSLAVWKNPSDGITYVYVSDRSNRLIRKFTADGTWVADSPAAGSGTFLYRAGELACDSAGHVFASDYQEFAGTTLGRILVFGNDLTYIATYEKPGAGIDQLDSPQGLAFNAAGTRLAVADTRNHRYQIFGISFIDGLPVFTPETRQGKAPDAADRFAQPLAADFDSAGNLYILDRIQHRVKKYDANLGFVKEWGDTGVAPIGYATSLRVKKVGTEDLVFTLQGSITLSSTDGEYRGKIATNKYSTANPGSASSWFNDTMLVDQDGNCVVWQNSGNYLYKLNTGLKTMDLSSADDIDPVLDWQKNPSVDLPGLAPASTAITPEGNYLILDRESCTVTVLDPSGNVLLTKGSKGSEIGQFMNPQAIAVDSAGNIYVADCGNSRIQKFDSGWNFLNFIGEDSLSWVTAIAVKGAGSEIIAVSGTEPYVYRYVKR